MRQIEETYIQSGQVRFGYLHYIIKGEESQLAAEASECAGEQGDDQFWIYHDRLFEVANGEDLLAFNQENLKQFAVELDLDSEAFNECLESRKYEPIVKADTDAAWSLYFRATPSFLINGKALIGAQPFEVFQNYIENALNP